MDVIFRFGVGMGWVGLGWVGLGWAGTRGRREGVGGGVRVS